MIDKQILQAHYAEYASQPDKWVANMEWTKRSIVEQVVRLAGFMPIGNPAKVLVLGASDKRYLPIHHRIFNAVLGNADTTTYDIDRNHLENEEYTVLQHDVTKPFPKGDYDLIFSHELMKFLTPEEQYRTMINAYDALQDEGLAMHILHEPSIKGTSELRSWQNRVDPLQLEQQLLRVGIPTMRFEFESRSSVEWLRNTTSVVTRKYQH